MPGNKVKIYLSHQITKQEACEALKRWHDFYGALCDTHNTRCVKCGVHKVWHNDKLKHPFFHNNLEMLEWHSAKAA